MVDPEIAGVALACPAQNMDRRGSFSTFGEHAGQEYCACRRQSQRLLILGQLHQGRYVPAQGGFPYPGAPRVGVGPQSNLQQVLPFGNLSASPCQGPVVQRRNDSFANDTGAQTIRSFARFQAVELQAVSEKSLAVSVIRFGVVEDSPFDGSGGLKVAFVQAVNKIEFGTHLFG